ncbi:MAG TPA: FAD-binding oxidoreductase [Solirubrobacteraceae bacterium]|nr:FAD-binding oxidoreductase [Solirubrobacteraceae bacterium]
MLSTYALADKLKGRVITPDDADYEEARTVFYGTIDRRPTAIARVADADDVARVIASARESDLELAVRSGGHSPAGHGVTDGGVVIDLSEMRGLEIDAANRTAWAEGGVTAGQYTVGAGEHGLATGFGDTGSVGVAGITLSGGVGFLVRKHGLTIDSLLAAEIVTADGELLYTDAENDPELFWAIRGGGGNFGVVTRLKFRLHELEQVIGGMLILPATPDVIEGFVTESFAAPDELSAIGNVMKAPPMPFLPPEVHGKLVVMALMAYAGDTDAGAKVIDRFRALAEPLADMIRPMPYPEIYPPEQEGYRPLAVAKTMFGNGIGPAKAETIVERIGVSTAMMAVTQIRVLGGAMAAVPDDATAFAHRQSRMMFNVATMYERPEERAEHEPWVDDLAARLYDGDDGAYVGFLADEGQERVRAAYPGATWDRLAAVKATYDPDNVFRMNQNIPPG